MTNHGDERPIRLASERCTIGELSDQVGMTVRNIRAYQARGLLPPPVVDGRVGYYTQTHRERLTMIRRLRAEGFNLVAISALLTGVVPVTTPTGIPVESTGHPSRGGETDLSDAGAALLALGVPVDAVLALHREIGDAVTRVVVAYREVYEEHVRGPWVAAGSAPDQRPQVMEAAVALTPIAAAAVTATLVPAMRLALAPEPMVLAQEPAALAAGLAAEGADAPPATG